jgi:hypothetical protein
VISTLCVQARETMQEAYGERFLSPALLKQRVRAAFGCRRKRLGWRGGRALRTGAWPPASA